MSRRYYSDYARLADQCLDESFNQGITLDEAVERSERSRLIGVLDFDSDSDQDSARDQAFLDDVDAEEETDI